MQRTKNGNTPENAKELENIIEKYGTPTHGIINPYKSWIVDEILARRKLYGAEYSSV